MLDLLVRLAEQSVFAFGFALLILLLFTLELGYLAGKFFKQKGWVKKETNMSAGIVVGGMLTFMAFFLGVALSIGSVGFQKRTDKMINEANALDTAWLIAGSQADETGKKIQQLLETYTKVRSSAFADALSQEERARIVERLDELKKEIWALASTIAKQTPNISTNTLLLTLSDVFNVTTEQRAAFDMRVPTHVGKLLIIVATLACLAVGLHLGMLGSRMIFMSTLLVITIVGAIALVSDISRPHHGSVNVSPAPLTWTLEGFRERP